MYYYQGDSYTTKASSPFYGGYDNDYIFTDEKDIEDYVWAPCGGRRLLQINTDLRLNKGSSWDESYLSVDSTDISVATKLNVVYKRC